MIAVFGCPDGEAGVFEVEAARLGVAATISSLPPTLANVHLADGRRCVSVDHTTPLTAAVLEALGRLGVGYVSTRSIGVDHIDLVAADRVGITVGNVRYSPDGVADYTLMLLLMAVRDARSTILRSAGSGDGPAEVRGRELRDLTIGVVGVGRIGGAVVERLRGFGCRVLTHDCRGGDAATDVPLDDLLRQSDVVTLHTPLTSATHHLLDRRRIALLPCGAFVVNTGRGALVDTVALVDALEAGHLAGAALDVVEGELDRSTAAEDPLLERLRRRRNVVITPHTAYFTDRALRDTVETSLRNCVDHERNR